MHTPRFPEDSVLRRHFESAAAMKRQAWLELPPTDAVLRRHYEQLHQAASGTSTPQARPVPPVAPKPEAVTAPKPEAVTAPKPEAVTASTPSSPDRPGRSGFFGWLSRLFGG